MDVRFKRISAGRSLKKLEYQATFVVGKLRRGSSLTRQDTLACLCRIGRAMQRYGLNSIKDIKPTHVQRYFAELRDGGMSPGRMANHATAMRLLCRMLGKSEIVPSNREIGCSRNQGNRTKNANIRMDVEKTSEVRSRLSENNRIAYDMARAFGLRQKETLLSYQTVERDGSTYLIVEGAKGGRPREIKISNDFQRTTLDSNRNYRIVHGGKLIDGKLSLKQGLKALQNELSAAGATRDSRANMHTLRRDWVIERCQLIAAAPTDERQALVANLVEELGHGRISVILAYATTLKK